MGWLSIIPAVGGWVAEYFKGKQKITAANAEAKADHQTARINALAGYTDEMAYFVVGYSFLSLLFPWTAPYTMAGFSYLEQLPEWYAALLVTATLSAIGAPQLIRVKGAKSG